MRKTSVIEAEKMLLGAVLLNAEALIVTTDILEPTDFYGGNHRAIYSACLDVYQTEGEYGPVSVVKRLESTGDIDRVGGSSYVYGLAREAGAPMVKQDARAIKEASILRGIGEFAKRTIQQVDRGEVEDIPAYFGELEGEIIGLAERIRAKNNPRIQDILGRVFDDLQKVARGEKTCIKTSGMFEQVPGFYPGHLWIVGGYTSVGKSTFLAQLVADACTYQQAKCLLFSTEDGQKDKAIKLISNLSDIPQWRIVSGKLDEQSRHEVTSAVDCIKKWDIAIYDDVYTVDEMRLKAKKHKIRAGLDLVFVDFVQNVKGSGTIYERMSDAAIGLQSMAKELEICVVALSQVNNDSMREESGLIGLKGAGELAAAADVILWLTRNKEKGHERDLDVAIRKNRPFGRTGLMPMQFTENWTRIERREGEHDNGNRDRSHGKEKRSRFSQTFGV